MELLVVIFPIPVRHDAVGAKREDVIKNGLETKRICGLDMHLYIHMSLVPNENADGDSIGNGGAGAAGINRMLTNHGHVQPVLCNSSAL